MKVNNIYREMFNTSALFLELNAVRNNNLLIKEIHKGNCNIRKPESLIECLDSSISQITTIFFKDKPSLDYIAKSSNLKKLKSLINLVDYIDIYKLPIKTTSKIIESGVVDKIDNLLFPVISLINKKDFRTFEYLVLENTSLFKYEKCYTYCMETLKDCYLNSTTNFLFKERNSNRFLEFLHKCKDNAEKYPCKDLIIKHEKGLSNNFTLNNLFLELLISNDILDMDIFFRYLEVSFYKRSKPISNSLQLKEKWNLKLRRSQVKMYFRFLEKFEFKLKFSSEQEAKLLTFESSERDFIMSNYLNYLKHQS